MKVASEVYDAIILYFVYGFEAGSYTTKVIMGEDDAIAFAHPHLLADNQLVHRNHKKIADMLPDDAKGENTKRWKGLKTLDQSRAEEYLMYLKLESTQFANDVINEYKGVTNE